MISINSKISSSLQKLPSYIKEADFPLTQFNLADFEGIQKGIKLFDEDIFIPLKDIAFSTKKLETINLYRGCNIDCTHCLKNAQPRQKGVETILYEDLIRLTEGFKTLSERFGFNILQGNRYINIIDDANPSDIPIRGLNSEHDVVEGMKLIYEKFKIPTLYVTSGWNKASKYAQNSAESLVKMIKQTPDSVLDVEISINPFAGIMEKSREALKKHNQEKANFFREIYTSKMANVLATFTELFTDKKATLIYRHANDNALEELVKAPEAKKIYEEIYAKLKKIIGSKIEDLKQLNPEKVTAFDKSHLIEPSGRARRYFPLDENMKLQSHLINESLNWAELTKHEQKEILQNIALKGINIDGSIYTTKSASQTPSVNTPIELIVPTNIKFNFINKQKAPEIFSDIELDLE